MRFQRTFFNSPSYNRQSDICHVRRAEEFFDRYLVTKNGKEAAVFMSAEEYESLLETIDVLASRREIQALSEASHQVRKGETISLKAYRSQKKLGKKRQGRR